VVASSAGAELKALATAAAAGAGLVLEDVTVTPAGRRRVLRVVVDLPETRTGGVPLDTVAEVSRALSAALDAHDVMGATPYVLEVSSPGVDRPLTLRRHFARARGRRVSLVMRDGTTASGRLLEVAGDTLVLDDAQVVPLAAVVRGRVEVEFNPPGAQDLVDTDLDDTDLVDTDPDDTDPDVEEA